MKYNTGKREHIIEFLSENSARAYTLEEISSFIAPEGRGRSTVYRIISELVLSGEVKRLSDGKTRHCTYQYIGDEECHSHLHLKCRDCGRLIHLDDELSHTFVSAVLSARAFALEEGSMLFGKCLECRELPVKDYASGKRFDSEDTDSSRRGY